MGFDCFDTDWFSAMIAGWEQERRAREEEEKRRKSITCQFTDGISQVQFIRIVNNITKRIKRISKTTIEGPIVCCTVQSQSKLTEWDFTIDYNDYGHLTGEYWLWSENDDSSIPNNVAENIRCMIVSFPGEFVQNEDCSNETTKTSIKYCPCCGKTINYQNAKYCAFCGTRLQ